MKKWLQYGDQCNLWNQFSLQRFKGGKKKEKMASCVYIPKDNIEMKEGSEATGNMYEEFYKDQLS